MQEVPNIPFGIQLYTLAMYEVEFVEIELKKLKLDKNQFLYLIIPSVFPGIVQSTIAQYFNVNKSTAGRMIQKLINKNYLQRERAINGRDFNVFLTPQGEQLKDEVLRSMHHYEEVMLQNINDKTLFLEQFKTIFDTTRTKRKEKKRGGNKIWSLLNQTMTTTG